MKTCGHENGTTTFLKKNIREGVTLVFLRVLFFFIRNKTLHFSGTDIMNSLQLQSGSVYPMLKRMEADNLITSEKETGCPKKLGRPLKILYTVTPLGIEAGKFILNELVFG